MTFDDTTRMRVLQAAGPVFAEKGFRAATVREICNEAGVNGASVNYHFGDKERLYIETVKHAHQLRAESVPIPKWPTGTAPEAKLKDFIRTLITRMVGTDAAPWQSRLMMREMLQPTSACRALAQDSIRPDFELLLGILDELLPSDVPKHRRQQIAFSVVGQCLFYRVAGEIVSMLVGEDDLEEHFALEQLAEHIAQFCLGALGAAQPLTPKCESDRHRIVPESIS